MSEKKDILNIDEISKRISPIAKRYQIDKVYLFGSYARGEADSESDIDLAVYYKQPIGLMKLIRVENELSKKLGKPVDLLTGRQIDLALQKGSRFGKRYQQEKREVYAEQK